MDSPTPLEYSEQMHILHVGEGSNVKPLVYMRTSTLWFKNQANAEAFCARNPILPPLTASVSFTGWDNLINVARKYLEAGLTRIVMNAVYEGESVEVDTAAFIEELKMAKDEPPRRMN